MVTVIYAPLGPCFKYIGVEFINPKMYHMIGAFDSEVAWLHSLDEIKDLGIIHPLKLVRTMLQEKHHGWAVWFTQKVIHPSIYNKDYPPNATFCPSSEKILDYFNAQYST